MHADFSSQINVLQPTHSLGLSQHLISKREKRARESYLEIEQDLPSASQQCILLDKTWAPSPCSAAAACCWVGEGLSAVTGQHAESNTLLQQQKWPFPNKSSKAHIQVLTAVKSATSSNRNADATKQCNTALLWQKAREDQLHTICKLKMNSEGSTKPKYD